MTNDARDFETRAPHGQPATPADDRGSRGNGPKTGRWAARCGLLLGFAALGVLSACGSSATVDISDGSGNVATQPADSQVEDVGAQQVTQDGAASNEGGESVAAVAVDDCNYDEFVYTPVEDVPVDWPETFPRPEGLVEIQGDIGMGCDRTTVDVRSRYYGSNGRDWMTAYGDQLAAAGFELANDSDRYDDLLEWNRTYRRGQDWISYGGDFELVGRDGEYLSLGISLADFPG